MIEIHTHILPNVDDGSKSLEMSIEMIEDMISNGVTSAIATPHHLNSCGFNPWSSTDKKVEILNTEIKKHNLSFKVYTGQEIRIRDDLLNRVKSGEIQGINNSRYLLLEFSFNSVPMYCRQIIYDLLSNGYIPIIAHPERIKPIQDDINILKEFIDMGCFAQITASSITSAKKNVKNITFEQIEEGLISFISSDNHDINKRKCELKNALKTIDRLYGSDLKDYFINNTFKLVNDKNIKLKMNVQKKSFIGRLFNI